MGYVIKQLSFSYQLHKINFKGKLCLKKNKTTKKARLSN